MPHKPYRVFISSTYLDNVERRKLVEEVVISAKMLPVGMERFTASEHPTVEECQKMAAEADVLVGIIAHRYGSIPPGYDLSITELEYRAARGAGKPRLMFVLNSSLPVYINKDFDEGADKWDKQNKLEAFKKAFSADQMPAMFEDNTLGIKVLEALQKWQAKKESSLQTPTPAEPRTPDISGLSDEISQYRKSAESIHATLPIAGFKTKLRVPIDLVELYVPLQAMLDLRATGDACFSDASDAEQKVRQCGGASELELTRAFIEAKNRKRQGLVILGDPGSGKTTHLKRLLLWCLREGPESLGLPKEMLPIFLPLRELKDLTKGLDAFIQDAFIQAQLDQPHLGTPPGFGQRLLKRGNLLFLLDGLDEVADPGQRQEVARWIEKALPARSDCRFVVTCRFAGYGQEVRLNEKFLELHLRPLNAEQASKFVHNWYRIVETGLAVDPKQGAIIAEQRADALVDRLNQPDFRARSVFQLTRNPLLLANICLVHRDRGVLPQKRADLYDECIEVLLERWREAKGLAGINAKTGRRVLQPAAYWMHSQESRTRARADELISLIEPVLNAVKYQGGDARDFLHTVRDQSGLLTGWGDETYGFMHLGFQEYLAAQEIRRRFLSDRDNAVLAELAGHFGDSWWQEVTLLLLALENPPFEALMHEVLKSDLFVKNRGLMDLCFEDAIEINDKAFIELIEEPPNQDRALWARQLEALKVLEQRKSDKLEALKDKLRSHPSKEIHAWLQGRALEAAQETILSPRGGYELVLIPGRVFNMGSPDNEEGRWSAEGPVHKVEVPSFYLGRYPVTNEQYAMFLSANPGVKEPEYWANRELNQPRQPVVGVSWEDAKRYANWAGLRLPSEAEWEYACRAGTGTRYYSGNNEADLDRVGWYVKNSGSQLHPVGEKEPNVFGLYDMHGNVWEWIEDDWHGNYQGAPTDGRAWVDKKRAVGRVVRGGSWFNLPERCRSASRIGYLPVTRIDFIGFRLLLDFH